MKKPGYLSLAVAGLLASTGIADAQMIPVPSDPVATSGGAVAGTMVGNDVRAYLGIPYAKPPVGDLRWAPPQPNRWQGVWNADRRGPECIQVLRPHNINHYFGEEPSSENCLFLNLWAPAAAKPGEKRPVIVFIYGGGFTVGSSGMANYGGESMARKGAIFVNFNYRVGALGFLAHPELSREQGGHSGNYGLMDQAIALRWVHDNIARFGGDPDKVVIMGQSAGARSVTAQIFSPLSRGLFRGAVMSSGCNWGGTSTSLGEAEKVGVELQKLLGAKSVDDMRQVPADRILARQGETQLGVNNPGVRVPAAIIDGVALTADNATLLKNGDFAKVPIIASYNGDDIDIGRNPIRNAKTVAEYRSIAQQMYGADAAEFLRLFPVRSDADVPAMALRAAHEAGFEANARECAADNRQYGNAPGYIDQFVRKHPYVPGVAIADQDTATIGAYHTADIPYFFGTMDSYNMFRPTRNWTDWDRKLSNMMMDSLIAFANTGSPSTAAMPWPAWTPQREVKLVLGDTVRVEPLEPAKIEWLQAHPFQPVTMDRRGARD